jgi:hypothetical protein
MNRIMDIGHLQTTLTYSPIEVLAQEELVSFRIATQRALVLDRVLVIRSTSLVVYGEYPLLAYCMLNLNPTIRGPLAPPSSFYQQPEIPIRELQKQPHIQPLDCLPSSRLLYAIHDVLPNRFTHMTVT